MSPRRSVPLEIEVVVDTSPEARAHYLEAIKLLVRQIHEKRQRERETRPKPTRTQRVDMARARYGRQFSASTALALNLQATFCDAVEDPVEAQKASDQWEDLFVRAVAQADDITRYENVAKLSHGTSPALEARYKEELARRIVEWQTDPEGTFQDLPDNLKQAFL